MQEKIADLINTDGRSLCIRTAFREPRLDECQRGILVSCVFEDGVPNLDRDGKNDDPIAFKHAGRHITRRIHHQTYAHNEFLVSGVIRPLSLAVQPVLRFRGRFS